MSIYYTFPFSKTDHTIEQGNFSLINHSFIHMNTTKITAIPSLSVSYSLFHFQWLPTEQERAPFLFPRPTPNLFKSKRVKVKYLPSSERGSSHTPILN